MYCFQLTAQINSIVINAALDNEKNLLNIEQEIVFHNNSLDDLNEIYLHNWANSFKDSNTPLGKRFINDYKSSFYLSSKKNRGYSKIKSIAVNSKLVEFKKQKDQPDIIKVLLKSSLKSKKSVVLKIKYTVKIPNGKFTKYGTIKNGYHLRYWYLTPAIYNKQWELMSNLNLDDLYQDLSNYNINITLPNKYFLNSNLNQQKTTNKNATTYHLSGLKRKDIIIHINSKNTFKSFVTKEKEIKTDAFIKKIPTEETTKIIQQQIDFIESFIGKHPHPNIFVDSRTVNKNSLHEIYGLPSWLKPFPKNFRWEINFFKALSKKYIDDVLITNQRKDYWLTNGLQTFLMMEYVKKYYPDVTVLGKFSKYWFIKKYNISKLKQNDKYPFVYQFSARKFFDQALTTKADSLSNFNRKVVSKYKAGLGLKYLQDFVGDSILRSSLKEFYFKNELKITTSNEFEKILTSKTNKDVSWFFGDYISTSKKIDYKINKVIQEEDSLKVTIKNKRNFTAPVALYGIKDREIKFKKWVTNVDSTKTITIPKNGFDKLALNYENLYPEYNSLDNFRKTNNSLLNKPLQFRLYKDVEDPYYNQIFYTPNVKYNLYDGLILGINFNNRPVLVHNFSFSVTPNYSTKSKNFT